MKRACHAAIVATACVLFVGLIASWVCLGIFLATTHRDGWMTAYSIVSLWLVFFIMATGFHAEQEVANGDLK